MAGITRSELAADFGCDEPEDDLLPVDGCPYCDEHRKHGDDEDAAAHGRWYVGIEGYGFRTNRCPRSWASHAYVAEVREAARWAEGGVFLAIFGLGVPNRLVEAVEFFRLECDAVLSEELRKARAEMKRVREEAEKAQGR